MEGQGWVLVWDFFLCVLFGWEKKIWPGPCIKLIFYPSSGSLFLGYYQNVPCLGGKYLWGKKEASTFPSQFVMG